MGKETERSMSNCAACLRLKTSWCVVSTMTSRRSVAAMVSNVGTV